MSFVVDCSVALPWFFDDEKTDYTEGVLDQLVEGQAVAPALWRLEFANALLTAVRRRRISETRQREIIAQVEQLPILIDRHPVSLTTISNLAMDYQLTAYDAAYLEVALRLSLPLASLDADLLAAAKKKAVAVVTV